MKPFKFFKGYVYSDEYTLPTINLPMITRMVGRTIANDLVPVQPLNVPSGLLFYTNYLFEGEQVIETIRHARL